MNAWRRARVARHLAAILAADIAGYGRLMGEDEEGTLAALRVWRRVIADPRIREHRGRIVKTTGDGFLVEFASVVDAVHCAVEMQRAMAERNAGIPVERRIEFRIGINLGDIITQDHDIYGDGVNVAARLEALAEPGGICISRVVRDQIRDKLPYVFEDMGEQLVKNIARPVRAYAMSAQGAAATAPSPLPAASARRGIARAPVVIAASLTAVIAIVIAGWWAWPPGGLTTASVEAPPEAGGQSTSARGAGSPAASASRLSIVVLPFENLSRDPDQEYFADGITENLTTDLSRISGSFVIARNTAFTYKGKSVDVKRLGRDLGVHYALEGSVQRLGDRVQVSVQLIDTESGAHVWADRFETDRRNLVEAQSEITGRLARTLNLELVQAVGRRIEQERAVDPDARDLVMRGWALYQRPLSESNRREALQAFERAHTIDPNSIDAEIGIAAVLAVNLANGSTETPKEDEARAEKLLADALQRDPNRSQLHVTIGLLRRLQNRLTESRIEWERAIALDPNNAAAYGQLGVTLIYLGDPAAAIPLAQKRIRLNPNDPNIALAYWSLGLAHLLLHNLDEAIDFLIKARAANPQIFYIHLDLAAAMALKGYLDDAHAALGEAIRLRPAINSMARQRARSAYTNNPAYRALAEKTVDVGLRLAGMPEE
jgi:TolB-like protein/class 3 adenylate cyclase/Flp pilus assembly protein TadD